jgi:pimeloyl-ACP methyl ester carboxylesterase
VEPGVLVLAPMVLGGTCGLWLAHRAGNNRVRAMGRLGRTATGLATVALVAEAIMIARPAGTAPILGSPDPERSVAELTTISVGSHDQALVIRGRSVENPVLLYVAGGPRGTDVGAMRGDVSLEVPVYVVIGEHEARGRAVLAEEWFGILDAPAKEWIAFDGAGHRPQFDDPRRFAKVMAGIAADTYRTIG